MPVGQGAEVGQGVGGGGQVGRGGQGAEVGQVGQGVEVGQGAEVGQVGQGVGGGVAFFVTVIPQFSGFVDDVSDIEGVLSPVTISLMYVLSSL